MIEVIYLLIFFLCLAAAAGSILLSQKLKSLNHKGTFESLYYYAILISFFGFYGVWGQVLIRYILSYLSASPDIIQTIGYLFPLFGFPFLIMAGYMLLKFMHELWGEQMEQITTVAFSIFYLVLLLIFGWISFHEFPFQEIRFIDPLILVILFFIIQDSVIHIWFLIYQFKRMNQHHLPIIKTYIGKFVIAFLILVILKIATIILTIIFMNVVPVFILIYFLSLVLPVFYLYIKSELILYEVQPDYQLFDDQDLILTRNGITRREREVVNLICAGKTNQEIADLLFITLQTVKDHTHRIYLKLDIKNRMQLIHLLRG